MYHEKITNRRELAENLSDHLTSVFDGWAVCIDLTAQEIYVRIPSDMTGESDADRDGHEVVWLDPIDSHEGYEVMEDFARSRPEERASRLFDALAQRHPFKTFRRALEYTGQLEDWYAFKNKADADLCEARLEDSGVDVIDGKIVCTNADSISIYMSEDYE